MVLGVLVLGVGSVTRDSVTVKVGGGVCVAVCFSYDVYIIIVYNCYNLYYI